MLIECPHCNEKIDVSEIAPGEHAVCPKCGGELDKQINSSIGQQTSKPISSWILIPGIIIFFALITIPYLLYLRSQAYKQCAKSAGRKAKLAEERWWNDSDGYSDYSNQLSDLLSFDKSLTDDPEVTFVFGDCDTSGYTYTTEHVRGHGTTFLFTD